MTTLKDGRFAFIHADRQHLLVEQPSSVGDGAVSGAPLSTQLLYGGIVHAFALNAAQTRIALVCPAGSAATPLSAAAEHLDAPQTVLRLFSFSNGEVGELLDELVTVTAQQVVWVGDRFIALAACRGRGTTSAPPLPSSQPSSSAVASSTILVEVTKSPQRLRLMREEKSSASPAAGPGSVLCDLVTTKQSLRLWDLQRNKHASECQLPNRKCRHGKARVAVAASSDGPFVFVANDDWTVHGFYISRGGGVHAPKPMLTQFESQSMRQANQAATTNTTTTSSGSTDPTPLTKAGEGEGRASEEGREKEGEVMKATAATAGAVQPPQPPSARSGGAAAVVLPTPRLFVRMLSDTQVLLALQGSPTILQCAYNPKAADEEWTIVAKMRLPRRLHASAEVVALAKKRCLVRQREALDGDAEQQQQHVACTYLALPLEMKPTTKGGEEAIVAVAAAEDELENAKPCGSASGAVDATNAAATEDGAATEGKRKRKNKKKAAGGSSEGGAVVTASARTPPPPAASPSTPASASRTSGNSGAAAGPTQRAVQRLLVHNGIAGKDQLPNAFARDGDASDGVASKGTDGAPEAAATDAGGRAATLNPPTRAETWPSIDVVETAAWAALGVVVGIFVLRKLSLL